MIIDTNNAANISVGTSSVGASTMDALTMLQFALLKDADDQLKGMVKQMQGNIKLKEAYRADLATFRGVINQVKMQKGKEGEKAIKSEGKDMKEFLKQYGLEKFIDEKGYFNNLFDYQYDTAGNNGNGSITATRDDNQTIQFLDGTNHRGKDGAVDGDYWLTENSVQTTIDYLNTKVDKLNSETEQLQIYVQDLTGKRKSSLESITSLISKVQDISSNINRNIGK